MFLAYFCSAFLCRFYLSCSENFKNFHLESMWCFICTYVLTCGGQRLMAGIFLKSLSTLGFRQSSSLNQELSDSARLAGQWVPGVFCVPLLSASFADSCCLAWSSVSTLLTVISPAPRHNIFSSTLLLKSLWISVEKISEGIWCEGQDTADMVDCAVSGFWGLDEKTGTREEDFLDILVSVVKNLTP